MRPQTNVCRDDATKDKPSANTNLLEVSELMVDNNWWKFPFPVETDLILPSETETSKAKTLSTCDSTFEKLVIAEKKSWERSALSQKRRRFM